MPHEERPHRAEDAIAQLKRSREQTAEAVPEKRAKIDHEPTDLRADSELVPAGTTVDGVADTAVDNARDSSGSAAGLTPESARKTDRNANNNDEKNIDAQKRILAARIPQNLVHSVTNSGASSVNNYGVLEEVANFERRQLGSVVYAPKRLLARGHELDFNCVLQVKISHGFLTENAAVQRREVWGTDVYTDDTDLVAALHHLGYLPLVPESLKERDLLVEILLLPRLLKYTGSTRNGMLSRSWLKRHDGLSYMVLGKPRLMTRGWATAGKETLYERFQSLQELRTWDPQNIVYI